MAVPEEATPDGAFALACFGFRYLGKVEAKKILSRYTLPELGNLTESDLASIKGFGDKKCPSIIKSLHDNAALMQTMMEIGFNINYLTDVLTNLSAETLQLAFGDGNRSALFTLPEQADFKYIVMPMRI